MSNDPELPTFLRLRLAVYGILPDVAEHTWSVWDDIEWIGNIVLKGGWSYATSAGERSGQHDTWQLAVAGLVAARP